MADQGFALENSGVLIGTGRSSEQEMETITGAGILLSYQNQAFVATSVLSTTSEQVLDHLAIIKVFDQNGTAHRLNIGLNLTPGYQLRHPKEQPPVTHGIQLFFVTKSADKLKQKGLQPIELPDDPEFPELSKNQTMKMMGVHTRKITQKVMGSADMLLPFELIEGNLFSAQPADCVVASDSGFTFKEQHLFVPPQDMDTDDWTGSIAFVQHQGNWYPIGLCSAPEAQLINRRIVTEYPHDFQSFISFAHLQKVYDILESTDTD